MVLALSGVRPANEPSDGASLLVTSVDSPQSGLDMSHVKKLIAEVCGV